MSEFYSKSPDAPESHYLDDKLVEAAQFLRTWSGVPVRITSSLRTESHNASVGGARSSMHLQGKAIDLQFMEQNDMYLSELQHQIKHGGYVADELWTIGIRAFGHYETFAHLDTRLANPNGVIITGNFHQWGTSIFDALETMGEEGIAQTLIQNWKTLAIIGLGISLV